MHFFVVKKELEWIEPENFGACPPVDSSGTARKVHIHSLWWFLPSQSSWKLDDLPAVWQMWTWTVPPRRESKKEHGVSFSFSERGF